MQAARRVGDDPDEKWRDKGRDLARTLLVRLAPADRVTQFFGL
jgi:hypothetical protein